MVQVFKPCGAPLLIDMEAEEESLWETGAGIEKIVGPSHVCNFRQKEMLALYRVGSL